MGRRQRSSPLTTLWQCSCLSQSTATKTRHGVLAEQRPVSDCSYFGSTGVGGVVCSLASLSLAFVLVGEPCVAACGGSA